MSPIVRLSAFGRRLSNDHFSAVMMDAKTPAGEIGALLIERFSAEFSSVSHSHAPVKHGAHSGGEFPSSLWLIGFGAEQLYRSVSNRDQRYIQISMGVSKI
jgi:hypothetical protein